MTIHLPCTPTRWQMLLIRLIRLLARIGRFKVEERTGADEIGQMPPFPKVWTADDHNALIRRDE